VPTPLKTEEFQRLTGVSRETIRRLSTHLEVLETWQRRINLVGARTLDDPWRRHVLDSAQLAPLLPDAAGAVVDIGSGAGFPGLVLAILGRGDVHLVESNARKAAFLREAARQTATPVTVHPRRIEDLTPFAAAAVTARACAPLAELLDLAAPFMDLGAVGLFLKGAAVDEELTAARERFNMAVERHPSRSDPAATILIIRNVERHRTA
jgi:16S rRNA (guanine527-N7)-methyltransferase